MTVLATCLHHNKAEVMTKLIRTLPGAFVALIVFSVIGFSFFEAISGVIQFGKIDLSLPSSVGDFAGGLLLALPIAFGIMIVCTPTFLFLKRRSAIQRNVVGIIFGLLGFVLSGGLLMFVVPIWISAVAATVGVGVPVYVLMKSTDEGAR